MPELHLVDKGVNQILNTDWDDCSRLNAKSHKRFKTDSRRQETRNKIDFETHPQWNGLLGSLSHLSALPL